MSDGQDVRRAYDGPDIEHDMLLGKIGQHNHEDAERASSAAVTRQDIGAFVEQTGVNKTAYSWLRRIEKIGDKSQDQAMDIIRSLKTCIPMLESHISGQSEMEFDGGEVADDQVDEAADDDGVEEGSTLDAELDDEAIDFNNAVDDVVTPFDPDRSAAQ